MDQCNFLVPRFPNVEVFVHPAEGRTDAIDAQEGSIGDGLIRHRRFFHQQVQDLPIGFVQRPMNGSLNGRSLVF